MGKISFGIFLTGLTFGLLHLFSDHIPSWFGSFGEALLFFPMKYFFTWQCWTIALLGYLLTGFFLYISAAHAASGRRGVVINPEGNELGLVIWIIFWPITIIANALFR